MILKSLSKAIGNFLSIYPHVRLTMKLSDIVVQLLDKITDDTVIRLLRQKIIALIELATSAEAVPEPLRELYGQQKIADLLEKDRHLIVTFNIFGAT